jgi:NAD(P)-dependent dehydrogenase (short-subunit alcohol dehydrogenase family)
MDLRLDGKTALVTGSTSGIGAGIAVALAREGARVVVNGRSEAKARIVIEAIAATGGISFHALGDLGTDDGARDVADQAVGAAGPIDILVNNVGGPVEGKTGFFDTSLAEWSDSFNGNALAAIRMIHLIVPEMRARGWGRVIQISSRNSISPHANMPSYGAAKAAMNNFNLSLSKELAFSGVTVNAIMPGLIYTQQLDQFLRDLAERRGWGDDLDKAREHLLTDICRQTVRRLGQVEDIAGYACYLASPLSDFITGTALRIDGGSTPTV